MDIAPTLLHLLDIPIPDDYDGSSMVEAFTSEHLGAHEMRFQKADGAASTDQASGYSAGEARAVSEHLRALGYIE
jgi:arylsulfatase A-like enzyme